MIEFKQGGQTITTNTFHVRRVMKLRNRMDKLASDCGIARDYHIAIRMGNVLDEEMLTSAITET